MLQLTIFLLSFSRAMQQMTLFNSESGKHEKVLKIDLEHLYHQSHIDRNSPENLKKLIYNHNNDQIDMKDYLEAVKQLNLSEDQQRYLEQIDDKNALQKQESSSVQKRLKSQRFQSIVQGPVQKPDDIMPNMDKEDDAGSFLDD